MKLNNKFKILLLREIICEITTNRVLGTYPLFLVRRDSFVILVKHEKIDSAKTKLQNQWGDQINVMCETYIIFMVPVTNFDCLWEDWLSNTKSAIMLLCFNSAWQMILSWNNR